MSRKYVWNYFYSPYKVVLNADVCDRLIEAYIQQGSWSIRVEGDK